MFSKVLHFLMTEKNVRNSNSVGTYLQYSRKLAVRSMYVIVGSVLVQISLEIEHIRLTRSDPPTNFVPACGTTSPWGLFSLIGMD